MNVKFTVTNTDNIRFIFSVLHHTTTLTSTSKHCTTILDIGIIHNTIIVIILSELKPSIKYGAGVRAKPSFH